MKNITLIYLFTFLLLTLNSCKKNSDDIDKKTYLITKQSWSISTIRQNINSSGWTDIFSGLSVCNKDDKLIFNSDNTVNWDAGLTKCNSSDPQIVYYGTWSFTSNQTKLSTTDQNGTNVEADIILLDDSNLITVIKYISGIDTTITETNYFH